jgi:Flp pilus assembly pilin Flp
MPRKHLAGSQEQGHVERGPMADGPVNQEYSMRTLTRIIRCQRGANAIEYALVASLIAIAAVAAMVKLGSSVDSMLNNVSNVM